MKVTINPKKLNKIKSQFVNKPNNTNLRSSTNSNSTVNSSSHELVRILVKQYLYSSMIDFKSKKVSNYSPYTVIINVTYIMMFILIEGTVCFYVPWGFWCLNGEKPRKESHRSKQTKYRVIYNFIWTILLKVRWIRCIYILI